MNPAKKVRLALVSCINGLLTKCTNTMKKTKVMLLVRVLFFLLFADMLHESAHFNANLV